MKVVRNVVIGFVALVVLVAIFSPPEDETPSTDQRTTETETETTASEAAPQPATTTAAAEPAASTPREREPIDRRVEDSIDCDYLLEGSGEPYRFVAGGDLINAGNVSVDVRVRVRWRQLGASGVTSEKRYRVRRGQTREVNITVPTTIDAMLAHQAADSKCSVSTKIVNVVGPPPLA